MTAAEIKPFRDIIAAIGTAQANESVVITAQTQEKVVAVHFSDGQTVSAGDLLVELDAREEQARVQELKFRLAEAKRQYQRLQDLARQNAASQQQLETQDVVVKEIVALLEVAETQLAQKRIVAPFDGRLGIRQISVGSLVAPGQEITTLDDITPIKLDFSVPELVFASLAIDQTITALSGAYPGREFQGIIRSIDSRVDPLTRSILVRAEVPNENLCCVRACCCGSSYCVVLIALCCCPSAQWYHWIPVTLCMWLTKIISPESGRLPSVVVSRVLWKLLTVLNLVNRL